MENTPNHTGQHLWLTSEDFGLTKTWPLFLSLYRSQHSKRDCGKGLKSVRPVGEILTQVYFDALEEKLLRGVLFWVEVALRTK